MTTDFFVPTRRHLFLYYMIIIKKLEFKNLPEDSFERETPIVVSPHFLVHDQSYDDNNNEDNNDHGGDSSFFL